MAGGGARKSTPAGWRISLTAFIMRAIHFFSVLSSNTFQIAYCGMLLNVMSLWSKAVHFKLLLLDYSLIVWH